MVIPWYAFAIGSAIVHSIFLITRKKQLMKVHAMAFESLRSMGVVFITLFFLPFLNFSDITRQGLMLVYITSLLGTLGIFFMSRALRHEDISLISPLENIKPAFVAMLAFFFLGEIVGTKEIIGIFILLIAAYLLESDHNFSDFLAPLKHIMKHSYSVLFFFAVFLFSFTAILDKFILSNHLDVFTYFFLLWLFVAINFNIVHAFMYGFKDIFEVIKKVTYMPLVVALLSVIGNLLALTAVSMAPIMLVQPVLMLATLFVVIVGGGYFHEKFLLFRIGASAIMLVGAYLIII